MKARLAIAALALALTGCTGATVTPTTPATASPSTRTSGAATTSATPVPTETPSASPTPTVTAQPLLTLGGKAIGDRPLGSTPQSLLEPDLVARLGKPKVGATQLCQLAGDRNRFALVDHAWGGLTVHYGRRAAANLAIGWEVALDRVPDGLRLVDRLPWRPTFAALAASDGVEVASTGGVKRARLTGRAISYTGEVGASSPDTVHGGPELTCQ